MRYASYSSLCHVKHIIRDFLSLLLQFDHIFTLTHNVTQMVNLYNNEKEISNISKHSFSLLMKSYLNNEKTNLLYDCIWKNYTIEKPKSRKWLADFKSRTSTGYKKPKMSSFHTSNLNEAFPILSINVRIFEVSLIFSLYQFKRKEWLRKTFFVFDD